jgi:hypothetical protein
MHPRHLGRLLTVVLALALLALLGTGAAALAVPPPDGGSVAPRPPCVSRAHLGHRQQVDPDSVTLCRSAVSEPTFSPSTSTRPQPARSDTPRAVLVAVLGFVALLAGLVAGWMWLRLRGMRPRQAT